MSAVGLFARNLAPMAIGISVSTIGLLAVIRYLLHEFQSEGMGIDDANIYLRYARNLADGHGFVWNPGGERVEGFTSLLWTLVITVLYLLTDNPAPSLYAITAFGVASALWIYALALARLLSGQSNERARLWRYSMVPLVLLWASAAPAFFIWTTSTLMETGPYCALVLLATAAMVFRIRDPANKNTRRAYLLALCALPLMRPEGLAWVGYFLAGEGLVCLVGDPELKKAFRRQLGLHCALLISLVALLFAFRLLYFGYPYPNTYYAKIAHLSREELTRTGWEYLTGYFQSYRVAGFAAVVACLFAAKALAFDLWWGDRERRQTLITLGLAGAPLMGMLLTVLRGGDHFDSWRFMQPIWPLFFGVLVILLCWLADAAKVIWTRGSSEKRIPALVIAAAAGLSLVAYISGPVAWTKPQDSGIQREFAIADNGRRTGERLSQLFSSLRVAYPTVGVWTAGGLPLSYRGASIDLVGLNNVEMAHAELASREGVISHAAFDSGVFYRQRPDFIYVRGCEKSQLARITLKPSSQRMMKGIEATERFRSIYQWGYLAYSAAGPEGICGFFANELVEKLGLNFQPFELVHGRGGGRR